MFATVAPASSQPSRNFILVLKSFFLPIKQNFNSFQMNLCFKHFYEASLKNGKQWMNNDMISLRQTSLVIDIIQF